jgi:hypothetical protein
MRLSRVPYWRLLLGDDDAGVVAADHHPLMVQRSKITSLVKLAAGISLVRRRALENVMGDYEGGLLADALAN